MENEPQAIIVELDGGIAWITINRPDRFNAFDAPAIRQLGEAIREIGRNPEIGVIVLTGAGDKAFCAGGDVGELASFSLAKARELFDGAQETFQIMRRVPQPIIAMVNGVAMGGGNELVICSDIAIASEKARFGQNGPKIGSSPIFGGTNLLAMTVGEKKAREIVYFCRQYSAAEACEMGWINKIVPYDALRNEVRAWCEELLERSPAYLELSKISSNVWWDMLTPSMEAAKQSLYHLAGGEQMTEGASAFLQKRKPDFSRFRSK
jgi:2-ketocyclohexanecarboxyl-CoA hydrolase